MSTLRKKQREQSRVLKKSPRGEAIAKTGGLRSEQRKERRAKRKADRQADKAAIKALKKSSRNTRRDRVNDAGEDIRMSRTDRRADRRATNKASRLFRSQERKARWATNKADKAEDRAERDAIKLAEAKKKQDAINAKSNILNESVSSSVKTKTEAIVEPGPVIAKTEEEEKEKKVVETASIVNDKMSFSQAYRAQRNANKASKTGHMDKKGNFTWRGKVYNTESKEEKEKRTGKKKEVIKKKEVVVNKKEEVEDHTGPGGMHEGAVGDTVSMVSPGPGWTKTPGTNIWSPPKDRPTGVVKQRKGGTRKAKAKKLYEAGGFLEPGIESLFED